MNFDNQFNDNPEIDPNKEYWCSPFVKSKGFTKLMKLVLMGDKYLDEIKKELLINPSTINIKNDKGWTALIISARNTNTKSSNTIIKLLLENKANINDKNNYGITALMYACENYRTTSSEQTVKLLLEYDTNIDDTATLIMLVNVTNKIIRNTVQTNIPINQSEP